VDPGVSDQMTGPPLGASNVCEYDEPTVPSASVPVVRTVNGATVIEKVRTPKSPAASSTRRVNVHVAAVHGVPANTIEPGADPLSNRSPVRILKPCGSGVTSVTVYGGVPANGATGVMLRLKLTPCCTVPRFGFAGKFSVVGA